MIRSAVAPLRLGSLGLAVILLLGGCSGGETDPAAQAVGQTTNSAEPNETTDAGETAVPAPPPTPAAPAYKPASVKGPAENVLLPVMPELARQESREGLEAFAAHWYELANYGYATGDVEPVRAVSGDTCLVCDGYYRTLASGYVDGDWIAGGEVHVEGVTTPSYDFVPTADGYFQAIITITQEPLVYYGPEGYQGTAKGIGIPLEQIMEAEFLDGGWHVRTLETLVVQQ
ncbi:DUF6318 family protein [Arthrobacter sunyaminii]|nr:DUF6318 family protein [Arthrobacter sunyaminii]